MVIANSQSDLESRFSHLLQPIRDLTKNWDVDIANHLEEYLEEIEHITITFDGGATTMNFAEAALVIQGSAGVYSRKVEYLYTLVYQVLDLLASKKKQAQASSVDGEGNDNDANFPKDADEEFLTLDDIKEHKNIVISKDREGQQMVHPLPRTPMALIPLGDGEKGENPLLSKTGEVLGSRNDFKMNTCNIHGTGAMLLDMSHLGLLESSMQTKTSTPLPVTQPASTGALPGVVGDGVSDEMLGEADNCDEGFPQDISMGDVGGDADDGPLPADGEPEVPPDIPPDIDEETVTMGLRRSERNKEHIADKRTIKPVIDHWKLLEPHCADSVLEKPHKKGRPIRLPATLQTNKKKRKRNPGPKPLVPISEFITAAFYSHSSKFPKNPLKVPTFPELERLYWQEFRRRQSFQRRERKVLEEEGRFEELAEAEQQDEPEINDDINLPGGDMGDDDGGDLEGDDAPGVFPTQLPIQDDMLATHSHSLSVESVTSQPLIVSSYEDLVRYHVEGFLASAQQYAQVTELAKRVTEWEEKIGPKLKEEESHKKFDIHEYGTSVIEHIGAQKRIPFRNIAAGKPDHEICRLFLATLQLANNYNVKIECKGRLEEAMDKMLVELLSTKRIYEELAEYRAPSDAQ